MEKKYSLKDEIKSQVCKLDRNILGLSCSHSECLQLQKYSMIGYANLLKKIRKKKRKLRKERKALQLEMMMKGNQLKSKINRALGNKKLNIIFQNYMNTRNIQDDLKVIFKNKQESYYHFANSLTKESCLKKIQEVLSYKLNDFLGYKWSSEEIVYLLTMVENSSLDN